MYNLHELYCQYQEKSGISIGDIVRIDCLPLFCNYSYYGCYVNDSSKCCMTKYENGGKFNIGDYCIVQFITENGIKLKNFDRWNNISNDIPFYMVSIIRKNVPNTLKSFDKIVSFNKITSMFELAHYKSRIIDLINVPFYTCVDLNDKKHLFFEKYDEGKHSIIDFNMTYSLEKALEIIAIDGLTEQGKYIILSTSRYN